VILTSSSGLSKPHSIKQRRAYPKIVSPTNSSPVSSSNKEIESEVCPGVCKTRSLFNPCDSIAPMRSPASSQLITTSVRLCALTDASRSSSLTTERLGRNEPGFGVLNLCTFGSGAPEDRILARTDSNPPTWSIWWCVRTMCLIMPPVVLYQQE
jgi:hypothetical protein